MSTRICPEFSNSEVSDGLGRDSHGEAVGLRALEEHINEDFLWEELKPI